VKRRSIAILVLAAALAACDASTESAKKFHATDIAGIDWARGFELTDHAGRGRTLADFRGKVVLVFFGFTNCPDACPTALAEMAQVVDRLGPDGARVQGIFITVDPERDTADVLSKYVPAFHPSFIGLRGSPEEIARTAKEFKVHYRANRSERGADAKHYLVDHTAAIFVLDPRGKPRLYVSANGRTVDGLAEDVKRLLESGG
jgi:protein SCO1/2